MQISTKEDFMTTSITASQAAQLAEQDAARQNLIGALANEAADASAFADYQADKPANTLRRQAGDLAVFARFLSLLKFYTLDAEQDADAQHKARAARLMHEPTAWGNITYGIVSGFVKWQLQEGYAVGSVNVRLATVKRYAKLAYTAGALDGEQAAKIATVTGFAYGKRAKVDENRAADGVQTRRGEKKAAAVELTKAQRRQLKTAHPKTAQGRRDALLMCLLLDHGLRCSEIAALEVAAFSFERGRQATFTFYRQKVRMWQSHELTRDSYKAASDYFDNGDAPAVGKLLCASRKGGELDQSGKGMSERAITKRVEYLGRQIIGVSGLSAHDGRHSAATEVARQKDVTLNRMVEMFGWNSPAMALQYIAKAQIANEGVDFND
ncbi:MAG: site-specific integrase [Hyphomicrobiaceae bacterium]|nr:MAG: site-specific integrase [Hyphomicrobiaceae bacterium]